MDKSVDQSYCLSVFDGGFANGGGHENASGSTPQLLVTGVGERCVNRGPHFKGVYEGAQFEVRYEAPKRSAGRGDNVPEVIFCLSDYFTQGHSLTGMHARNACFGDPEIVYAHGSDSFKVLSVVVEDKRSSLN